MIGAGFVKPGPGALTDGLDAHILVHFVSAVDTHQVKLGWHRARYEFEGNDR